MVETQVRYKFSIPGYELVDLIGRGGMGSVYRALQLSLDRPVAVKLLHPKLAEDPSYVKRFLAEARTAGRLQHANIVSALDCGQADGRFYMVMELVEGRSLAHVLKERGSLPEREALALLLQIAEGLQHAWSHGLIHRDIKPANIMLTEDGVAKLCDLGLCRDVRNDPGLTQAGFVQCTPTYSSPEQAVGRKELIDIRSDIYSLGVTFYEMLTGVPPFTAPRPADVVVKHASEPPVPPHRRKPGISKGASRLVIDMLAKRPQQRPRDPGILAARVRALLHPPAAPAALEKPPSLPVLVWWFGSIGSALFLAILLLLLLTR